MSAEAARALAPGPTRRSKGTRRNGLGAEVIRTGRPVQQVMRSSNTLS